MRAVGWILLFAAWAIGGTALAVLLYAIARALVAR